VVYEFALASPPPLKLFYDFLDFNNTAHNQLLYSAVRLKLPHKKGLRFMKTDLHEQVLKALSTIDGPATIEELTAKLVMGDQFDLGAVPLRAVYDSIEDAISAGGDNCPILKVAANYDLAGYILKDNKDPDILLDCPPGKTVAQKNSEGWPGAITCYGYGWERAKVYWCPSPKLLGYQYLTSVNFCEQVAIYMLHKENGKVRFVGCATDLNLGQSLYTHTIDELEQDWSMFSFFGFRPVADDGTIGRLPENVKMLDILHSMVKIIKEVDKPPSTNFYPDYHVSLRFNQLGTPM